MSAMLLRKEGAHVKLKPRKTHWYQILFYPITDGEGGNQLGIIPPLQYGGQFHEQAALRKKDLQIKRPHHGNVKK